MQVNTSTMFIFMLLILVTFQVYSTYHYSSMVWCTFRRVNKTRISKWAKLTQARVEFEGGWYDVEPSRITTGIKWLPLPMVVNCLDFRHNSPRALDPDTFDNSYTPEARKQLDKADDIRALEQGNQQSLTTKPIKQGMLQQYMPLITLIGFIIVGFLVYRQQGQIDKVGFGMNVVQEQLGKLLQNLPK